MPCLWRRRLAPLLGRALTKFVKKVVWNENDIEESSAAGYLILGENMRFPSLYTKIFFFFVGEGEETGKAAWVNLDSIFICVLDSY